MKYSRDYMLDLSVRLAHHSTAIEGNTLTQGETKSILIDHYIPKEMKEREYYEVKNYEAYMEYLASVSNSHITLDIIKDTHKILMQNLLDNNGEFKTLPNAIIGADFETTAPYLVRSELKNSLDNLKYRLDHSTTNEDQVSAIMDFHLNFERIHPFSDGNGRTGRALILHNCIKQGIVPIVITKDIKERYVNALNKFDKNALYTIALELQEKEIKRMKLFNSEIPKIMIHQSNSKGMER